MFVTDAALWLLDKTANGWDATAPARERARTIWNNHTRPAQRAGQITAAALAALLAVGLAAALVTGIVRLVTGLITGLVRGVAHALAYLWNSGAAGTVRDLADIPFIATRAWLRAHAQGLPATPAQIGGGALVLALVLFVSARRGSTAARIGFAILGAAGCAAVWQASPENQRLTAVAVSAGAWLLLAPSAYATRWWRPERRTRLTLNPRVEEALAGLAAAHRPAVPANLPAQQATHSMPTLTPHRRRLSPLESASSLSVAPGPAGGFRCRHCAQPLAWAATVADQERTWRTDDGSAACPDAPTTPALHQAL
ncbi:hypothetical protein [Kitasatospora sp. NPDC094015]|uniref:hypothetical protein n=1 Tax=Kitasatospora sp. NPDC094015 TaxID=3155205 RepID=UPI003317E6DD